MHQVYEPSDDMFAYPPVESFVSVGTRKKKKEKVGFYGPHKLPQPRSQRNEKVVTAIRPGHLTGPFYDREVARAAVTGFPPNGRQAFPVGSEAEAVAWLHGSEGPVKSGASSSSTAPPPSAPQTTLDPSQPNSLDHAADPATLSVHALVEKYAQAEIELRSKYEAILQRYLKSIRSLFEIPLALCEPAATTDSNVNVWCDDLSTLTLEDETPTCRAGMGLYFLSNSMYSLQFEAQCLPGLQSCKLAELAAIGRVCEIVHPHQGLRIYMDSQPNIDLLHNVLRKGSGQHSLDDLDGSSSGQAVLQCVLDLFVRRSSPPDSLHAKAHSSDIGNQFADRLARHGASLPSPKNVMNTSVPNVERTAETEAI